MDRESIEATRQQYIEEYQQYTQEATKLMQQANEYTTRATRLEGAIQALQMLLGNISKEEAQDNSLPPPIMGTFPSSEEEED